MKLHNAAEQPVIRSALVLTFMLGLGLTAMVNSEAIKVSILLFLFGNIVSVCYALVQLGDPKQVPHVTLLEVAHAILIGVGSGLVFVAYYHHPLTYGLLVLPAFTLSRMSGFFFFWVVYWFIKPQ